VPVGKYLKEHYLEEIFYDRQAKAHYDNAMFTGYDMDRTILRIGAMSINRNAVAA
jgi:type I restriction enzyme M protein